MKEQINTRLNELIPTINEPIFEATRYSLLSPGKRLRPLLALATCQTFGQNPLTILDPACAIEMVHTYSLIHDDLPCMDDDDLRRGRATLHIAYGEATALLAGDYLLTYAFEVISNANQLAAEQRIQMIQTLAKRSGSPGMIGGQALDIEMMGKEIDEETLCNMHEGKTSSLITASLEIGSIGANVPPSPILQEIGKELGLAYQFQDDLFDLLSTSSVLGKRTGSDSKKNKPTAVSILGIEQTKVKLDELQHSIDQKLSQLPNQGYPLKTWIETIFERKS